MGNCFENNNNISNNNNNNNNNSNNNNNNNNNNNSRSIKSALDKCLEACDYLVLAGNFINYKYINTERQALTIVNTRYHQHHAILGHY
ncbi:hypothetical protein PoB_005858900 [Plakobranchus ocellatus]|uniref:Uncharacterized protein n=1 Tax=Plakobranchus ocellatus TaxID=259542 RepID=A0AAV4CLW3_9GAST|nr:hypothetical protein PoB_005858900 [Plakobranchus ocellatus]